MFVESVNWSIPVLCDSLDRCIFRKFCFLFCNIILQGYIIVALQKTLVAQLELAVKEWEEKHAKQSS